MVIDARQFGKLIFWQRHQKNVFYFNQIHVGVKEHESYHLYECWCCFNTLTILFLKLDFHNFKSDKEALKASSFMNCSWLIYNLTSTVYHLFLQNMFAFFFINIDSIQGTSATQDSYWMMLLHEHKKKKLSAVYEIT